MQEQFVPHLYSYSMIKKRNKFDAERGSGSMQSDFKILATAVFFACCCTAVACKPNFKHPDAGSQTQSGALGYINKSLGIFGGTKVRSFLWSFPLESVTSIPKTSQDQKFLNQQKRFYCWYRLDVEDPSYFSPESINETKTFICSESTRTLSDYGISTDHFEDRLDEFKKEQRLKFWATQFAFSAAVLGKCSIAVGSVIGAMSCGAAIGWVNQFYDQQAGNVDAGSSAALNALSDTQSLSFDGIEAIDKVMTKTFKEHNHQHDLGDLWINPYISIHSCPAPRQLKICRGKLSPKIPSAFGTKEDGSLRALCYRLPNGKIALFAETAGLRNIPSGSLTGRIDHVDDTKQGRIEIRVDNKIIAIKAGRHAETEALSEIPKKFVIRAYALDTMWNREMPNSIREKTISNIQCTYHH